MKERKPKFEINELRNELKQLKLDSIFPGFTEQQRKRMEEVEFKINEFDYGAK